MKYLNLIKKSILFPISIFIIMAFMPIQAISQDTDESTDILNDQYEHLINILSELEVLTKNASKDLLAKQESTEKTMEDLSHQSQQLSLMLTELEILMKSNIENSKSLPETVSNNTDKLNEDSQYYITLLEEIEVLYSSLNQQLGTELIYEYDDENKLKSIKSKATNKIIYEFQYDDNGNLLKVIKK